MFTKAKHSVSITSIVSIVGGVLFICAGPIFQSHACPSPFSISWPTSSPVWTLSYTTPDNSQGIDGSGLQLNSVRYKGKQVFYRAHLPVLNVLYDPGGCGGSSHSYRDWQNELQAFEANNVVAPCRAEPTTPPETVCDHPGSDAGMFSGVAVEKKSDRLILTTQMQAGWYRYIQKWFFYLDGTIQTRFYFTAISDYCVSKPHHHHAYWRFDFDIEGPANDVIQEFNTTTGWHTKTREIKRLKNPPSNRRWRVRDTVTKRGYEVIPNSNDGVADSWAVADMWALRYHGAEIDDGGSTGGSMGDAAHMSDYINAENINSKDVVMWYRAGHRHESGSVCIVVGPTLKPVGTW